MPEDGEGSTCICTHKSPAFSSRMRKDVPTTYLHALRKEIRDKFSMGLTLERKMLNVTERWRTVYPQWWHNVQVDLVAATAKYAPVYTFSPDIDNPSKYKWLFYGHPDTHHMM